jgi:hypothetical protein
MPGPFPAGNSDNKVFKQEGLKAKLMEFSLPTLLSPCFAKRCIKSSALGTAMYLHTLEIRGKDARKHKKKKGDEQGEDEDEANEANTDS